VARLEKMLTACVQFTSCNEADKQDLIDWVHTDFGGSKVRPSVFEEGPVTSHFAVISPFSPSVMYNLCLTQVPRSFKLTHSFLKYIFKS